MVNRCAIHQHAAYELDFGSDGPIVIQLQDRAHIDNNAVEFYYSLMLPERPRWLAEAEYDSFLN